MKHAVIAMTMLLSLTCTLIRRHSSTDEPIDAYIYRQYVLHTAIPLSESVKDLSKKFEFLMHFPLQDDVLTIRGTHISTYQYEIIPGTTDMDAK